MLDKRKKSRWGEGLGCMRAGVGYCGSVGEQWSGCAGHCGGAVSVWRCGVLYIYTVISVKRTMQTALNMQ